MSVGVTERAPRRRWVRARPLLCSARRSQDTRRPLPVNDCGPGLPDPEEGVTAAGIAGRGLTAPAFGPERCFGLTSHGKNKPSPSEAADLSPSGLLSCQNFPACLRRGDCT